MIQSKQVDQVAFSITSTATVNSVGVNTPTKMTFLTPLYFVDSHGFFDLNNAWYKPTIPGFYFFWGQIQSGTATNAGEYIQAALCPLAVNNIVVSPFMYSGTANQQTMQVSWLFYMNGINDTMNLAAITNHASATFNSQNFCGYRI